MYVFSNNLLHIKKLKLALEKKFKRTFFINSFSINELDYFFKNNFFKHRDRTFIFLYEFLTNKFKKIYGKDIAKEFRFFLPFYEDLDWEIIQNILLFKYLSKKIFINPKNTRNSIKKYVKFSIQLYNIFYYRSLNNHKKLMKDLEKFIKKSFPDNFGDVLSFFDFLAQKMTKDFKKRYSYNTFAFKFNNFVVYGYFNGKNSNKALVYFNGIPKPSKIEKQIKFFTSKNIVFFNVFYPGYWESPGVLNYKNLISELKDLLLFIKEGLFFDIFYNSKLKFDINEISVIGSSFGGTLALHFPNSIAISPLTNFNKNKNIIDDLNNKLKFFREVIRIKNPQYIFYIKPTKPRNSLIIYDQKDPIINSFILKKYINYHNLDSLEICYGKHEYKLLNQYVMDKILCWLEW